jgi:hypothetical protein
MIVVLAGAPLWCFWGMYIEWACSNGGHSKGCTCRRWWLGVLEIMHVEGACMSELVWITA